MSVFVTFFHGTCRGVNQEPGRGGVNLAKDITNSVGHFTGNFVRYDTYNNGRGATKCDFLNKYHLLGIEYIMLQEHHLEMRKKLEI